MGNLIDLGTRTTDEQRRIARAGGIASGEARRERKKLREQLLDILAQPVPDDVRELTNCSGGTFGEALCAALVRSALSGNPRAFETIRDSIGEKPITSVDAQLQKEPVHFVFSTIDADGNKVPGSCIGIEEVIDDWGR